MDWLAQKDYAGERTIAAVAAVFVFIILTALSGFVRVPLWFTPVPLTLQTYFVLLAGAVLGARRGAASQAGYLLLGALGVPVFSAAGSGLAYLFGPTGGYLLGFIAAAWLLGRVLKYCRSRLSCYAAFIGADLLILACGSLWLAAVSGCGIGRALLLGAVPFIAGDMLKAFAAAQSYLWLRRRLI